MKKLLAIVISMAMIVAMMPMGVFAETTASCAGGTSCMHQAAIGNTHYDTLADAVNAVDTGVETTIELLRNVTDGTGIIVDSGKNIIINFAGHTYTVTGTPAGSTGTKNQCFQLLKDSTVIMNNGSITANSTEVTRIIQNYANLTLHKMTLDATQGNNGISTDRAVVSFNNGISVIDGETKITAKDGGIAFDVEYYTNAYPNGAKVTVNTTETIVGNICFTNWDGDNPAASDENKSTLTINNINHIGSIIDDCRANYNNNIKIDGGTFTSDPKAIATNSSTINAVTEGKEFSKNSNNTYTVGKPVAAIGNDKYASLQAAIHYAGTDNETEIRLLDDITSDRTIIIDGGRKIKLDLNKHNISAVNSTIKIHQGTLNVMGGGIIQEKNPYYAPIIIQSKAEENQTDYCNVIIGKDVTLIGWAGLFITPKVSITEPYAYGVNIEFAGKIKAKADMTGDGGHGIYINGQIKHINNAPNITVDKDAVIESEAGNGIYAAGYANWNLAGNINALYALSLKSGTFNITGGEYHATGEYADPAEANGNGSENTGAALSLTSNDGYAKKLDVTVTGGTFISDNGYAVYEGIGLDKNDKLAAAESYAGLDIKGGVFTGNVDKSAVNISTAKNKKVITGGTFSTSPTNYVVGGNNVYKLPNGAYVVAANGPSGYTWTAGTSDDDYDFIGTAIPYTPSTPADNVTNNTTDKNTTADLTPAVKDNKAETTVDAKTADKIVDKAVANKSTEVIVDAKGNNTVASSEVAIPEKTVKELAEKTDANLVIKTDNGQVDLDRTALAAVAEQAGTTGTVTLVVETVKTDENICHVDLKLVTSNGAVKDFKGGNVKVTINLTKELAAKELVCVYIDDNGIYTLVEGVLNADGTYTFTTGHFSEYAVMAKDEADKVIADQLKTMIKDVNLKVRTSKTSKKNIKAVVSGDVKALTDAGYTVKYKFYRSTKKASKYAVLKTKADNTYINTKGKKGTKYYYKAKALVYQGDKLVGQTVLTQCKYGVRIWSK